MLVTNIMSVNPLDGPLFAILFPSSHFSATTMIMTVTMATVTGQGRAKMYEDTFHFSPPFHTYLYIYYKPFHTYLYIYTTTLFIHIHIYTTSLGAPPGPDF